MSVQRLRTLEDAAPPPAEPLDGANLRAAIELSEVCLRLRPLVPRRGVTRFVSLEQANEDRLRWEAAG